MANSGPRPVLEFLSVPTERFPFFHEAQRSVHRDGHVEVDKAYYSVPPEYITRRVWVRWNGRLVRVFNDRWEQIAVHAKAEPGRFSTDTTHIAVEKTTAAERGTTELLFKASHIGPAAAQWAEAMLAVRGVAGVRVLVGLLSLTHQHSYEIIEKACGIAATYQAYRLRTIKQLIKRQAPRQEQFDFIQEHSMIRPIDEYAQFVKDAFRKER